jgi:glycosyltransferase involved in cell wall biosynthesis
MNNPDEHQKKFPEIRILISGHLPPPIGGMATYYQNLLASPLGDFVDYQFIQTSSQKRQLSSSGRASFYNLIAAIQDCARYTRAVNSYRPNTAHIGTAFGLSFFKHSYCVLLAYHRGIHVILHPHCSFSVLYNERSKLWKWFFRFVMKRVDAVIAMSQEWLELGSILPEKKVFYLPNFIDIDFYKPALERHKNFHAQEKPLKLLYLGYLGKAKGTFDLIDAADILYKQGKEVVFDLVGSELTPGELPLLHEKVRALHLEEVVRINPPAYGKEKIPYFSNADIFIYPSYHEGVPMAVLEAMASGLPLIATRVGGLPDLVHENGILTDPGKPDQLVDAILSLAADVEIRSEMQTYSYQDVCDRFNINKHVSDLVEIYRNINSEGRTEQ